MKRRVTGGERGYDMMAKEWAAFIRPLTPREQSLKGDSVNAYICLRHDYIAAGKLQTLEQYHYVLTAPLPSEREYLVKVVQGASGIFLSICG